MPAAQLDASCSGDTDLLCEVAEGTNRPPKGDRSEGFPIKIRFFMIFHQFGLFSIENNYLYMEIEPE